MFGIIKWRSAELASVAHGVGCGGGPFTPSLLDTFHLDSLANQISALEYSWTEGVT
jgi:hypothetical protein